MAHQRCLCPNAQNPRICHCTWQERIKSAYQLTLKWGACFSLSWRSLCNHKGPSKVKESISERRDVRKTLPTVAGFEMEINEGI